MQSGKVTLCYLFVNIIDQITPRNKFVILFLVILEAKDDEILYYFIYKEQGQPFLDREKDNYGQGGSQLWAERVTRLKTFIPQLQMQT